MRTALLLLVVCAPAFGQCRGVWTPIADLPGLRGKVEAMVEFDPDGPGPAPSVLVVAGQFDAAGGVMANRIAAWDGSAWSALGTGLEAAVDSNNWFYRDCVYTLLARDGVLIAGGSDLSVSGSSVRSAAMQWDGSEWTPLGSMRGGCSSLAEFRGQAAAAGLLALGSGVATQQIVLWDGQAWRSVGTLVNSSGPISLAVFNDELYAAGSFTGVDGVVANGLARFDGAVWHDEGFAATTAVTCLAAHGGSLYASVHHGANYNTWDYHLLRYDGAWTEAVNPFPGGVAYNWGPLSLASAGGHLYASDSGRWGGDYSIHSGVARLDEAGWVVLGGDLTGVDAFALFRGEVIAAGGFEECDGVGAYDIARMTPDGWRPLVNGLSARPAELLAFQGRLIAAGQFWDGSPSAGYGFVEFDGNRWRPVAPEVTALFNRPVLMGDGIYFLDSSVGFGRFDGTNVDRFPWEDGLYQLFAANNRLYAMAFDSSANWVLLGWDGSGWSPVGGAFGGLVNAVASFDGTLIAGGGFWLVGENETPGVAVWDGSQWTGMAVTPGIDRFNVSDFAVYRRQLYACGSVTRASGTEFGQVSRWNGAAWEQMAIAPGTFAVSLRVIDDRMYAIGPATAVFDGNAWRRLDGVIGLNDVASYGQGLVVAGGGLIVDGVVTNNLALLRGLSCCGSADFDGDGSVGTDADIDAFFACLAGSCCSTCQSSDFDADGSAGTSADIEAFFRVLAGGGC
jgi:hypothetical protein